MKAKWWISTMGETITVLGNFEPSLNTAPPGLPETFVITFWNIFTVDFSSVYASPDIVTLTFTANRFLFSYSM